MIEVKKGDIVRLTKITDEKFGGFHPNYIYEGYSQVGELKNDVTVGERCSVQGRGINDYLITSDVTGFISPWVFKTLNSTYKIELYEES